MLDQLEALAATAVLVSVAVQRVAVVVLVVSFGLGDYLDGVLVEWLVSQVPQPSRTSIPSKFDQQIGLYIAEGTNHPVLHLS